MLFTDGNFITPALLDLVDGEFSDVAEAEEIDPLAFIAEAVNSAGSEFTSKIQSFSGYLVGVGANANHQAAVLNILSTAINRPRALLNQIPATEPNPTRTAFRRWVQFFVLFEFYQAMSWRSTVDRYELKADKFNKEQKRAWDALKGNGFPVVLSPLPAPAACLEYNPGTWGTSNLSAVSGGSAPAAAWDVSITWCSLPSYISTANQGNAESAGAPKQTIQLAANQVIHIDITSLNPPNGTVPVAIGNSQGIYSPLPATHWNIYAGPSGQQLVLQNVTPVPIATKIITLPGAPATAGFPLGPGQAANYDFSFQNMLWRA